MTKMKKETVYPYIPNTAPDTKRVLMEAVNAKTEREIFDVIPDRLMYDDFDFPDPIPDEHSLIPAIWATREEDRCSSNIRA